VADSEERTEKATPKRRKKAWREGHIGNTPEFGTWAGMLVASFVLPWVFRSLLATGTTTLVQVGAVIESPNVDQAVAVARSAFESAFRAVLPMAGLIALVSVAAVAGQGGLSFAPGLLKPKFSHLNPLTGLKRIFGAQGAWNLAKALLKLAALAVVLLVSLRPLVPKVMDPGSLSLAELITVAVSTALNVIRFAAVAGLLMAIADYAVTRKRNNKQLKMTKQEVKDEFKSSEGDPRLRGARRSRALAMSRNRMMADIASADVVVVNPTHVAVALRYDPARGAPRVVAKGADHLAAKIREVAEKNRIPMVSDVPLARTLHATCEIGQEIPPDLYRAVATVLAFIMTLKRRGSAVGVHTVRTLVPAAPR
jgi:flagellar biosynthetic protein FlhB